MTHLLITSFSLLSVFRAKKKKILKLEQNNFRKLLKKRSKNVSFSSYVTANFRSIDSSNSAIIFMQ